MMKLHEQSPTRWPGQPFVARLTEDCGLAAGQRPLSILILRNDKTIPPGFRGYLKFAGDSNKQNLSEPILTVSPDMAFLGDGDIIHANPETGDIHVLYRRQSGSNTIFLTERCNSRCIMCPQPPKKTEDDCLVRMWLDAIPLMNQETELLGITGGEPTVVPEGFLTVVQTCKEHLPKTFLQVLTNGRMFNYMSLCREVFDIGHPFMLFEVPIYSDLSYMHDFIVQANDAFDQTIRGIMNLKRFGFDIAIRVVLMRQNISRLPDLARFIARNLSFVRFVALMGMEPMGLGAANFSELWVDPLDYRPMLKAAVEELVSHRMNVSIYNHQLCVLEQDLWRYARKSISDWKTEYAKECGLCQHRCDCGGFFASSLEKGYSRGIHSL